MSLSNADVFDAMASYDLQGSSGVAETLLTSTPKAASAITSCAKRAAAVSRDRKREKGQHTRGRIFFFFQDERSAKSILFKVPSVCVRYEQRRETGLGHVC